MADPINNPFNKQSLENLEDAVDLSRALVDNANELNRLYKRAGTSIQDTFNISARSLSKTLTNLSAQTSKMMANDLKKADAIKLQKKLDEGIIKLKQEADRLERVGIPRVQQQVNYAKARYDVIAQQLKKNTVLNTQEQERLELAKRVYERAKESLRVEEDAVKTSRELVKLSEEENIKVQNYVQNWDKANLRLGLVGRALKGFQKIPLVGDLINADKALESMQKSTLENKSAFDTLGAGIGAAFEGIEKSTIILAAISAAVKIFRTLKDIAFGVDKDMTSIAKSTGVMKEGAIGYYETLSKTVDASDDLFVTTKNQVEALTQLNSAFNTAAILSSKMLEDQIVLTKEMELSVEEASKLQALAIQNGISADKYTESALEGTVALYKQKNLLLDGKKVLQEVSKVSGQILAFYKNSPKLIGDAVAKTQALGVSLEQAKSITQNMLNFEDSIRAQMEAEVLIGKTLNLDKARELALRGKIDEAAQETLKNVGSFAEFSNLNVIQQEAIARALGMSADELSDSLFTQEKLNRLSTEDKKTLDEAVTSLLNQGKVEEANALKRRASSAKDIQAVLRQQTASAQFEQSMEKIKDIFTKSIAPVLERVMIKIQEVLPGIVDAFKTFGPLIKGAMEYALAPFEYIYNFIRSIKQVFAGDITEGIKNIGLSLLKFVLAPFKLITGAVDAVLGTNITSIFPSGPAFANTAPVPESSTNTTVVNSAAQIPTQKDFVVKSLPEDTVVGVGGTKLGRTDEMVSVLKEQNRLLAAILAKDTTISIDGQRVANVVARNVPTSYGNLLNPGSR